VGHTLLRGAAFDWIEFFLTDYIESLPTATGDNREAETMNIFAACSNFKTRINRAIREID
jgi:hypothetical protein